MPHRHGSIDIETSLSTEQDLAGASMSDRHGPACPGDLSRHGAGTGGPDKPGHDELRSASLFRSAGKRTN
jgi:hypothetical protein